MYEELKKYDKENYSKARNDLLKAFDSFEKLKSEQKEQLLCEIAEIKGMKEIANLIRSNYK